MLSFYGGQPGQSFGVKQIFQNRAEDMLKDLQARWYSPVGVGDYVYINYGDPSYSKEERTGIVEISTPQAIKHQDGEQIYLEYPLCEVVFETGKKNAVTLLNTDSTIVNKMVIEYDRDYVISSDTNDYFAKGRYYGPQDLRYVGNLSLHPTLNARDDVANTGEPFLIYNPTERTNDKYPNLTFCSRYDGHHGFSIKQLTKKKSSKYDENLRKDLDALGRSYNGTLWQKIYADKNFRVSPELPLNDENTYVFLHVVPEPELDKPNPGGKLITSDLVVSNENASLIVAEEDFGFGYRLVSSLVGVTPRLRTRAIPKDIEEGDPSVHVDLNAPDEPLMVFELPRAQRVENVNVIHEHSDYDPTIDFYDGNTLHIGNNLFKHFLLYGMNTEDQSSNGLTLSNLKDGTYSIVGRSTSTQPVDFVLGSIPPGKTPFDFDKIYAMVLDARYCVDTINTIFVQQGQSTSYVPETDSYTTPTNNFVSLATNSSTSPHIAANLKFPIQRYQRISVRWETKNNELFWYSLFAVPKKLPAEKIEDYDWYQIDDVTLNKEHLEPIILGDYLPVNNLQMFIKSGLQDLMAGKSDAEKLGNYSERGLTLGIRVLPGGTFDTKLRLTPNFNIGASTTYPVLQFHLPNAKKFFSTNLLDYSTTRLDLTVASDNEDNPTQVELKRTSKVFGDILFRDQTHTAALSQGVATHSKVEAFKLAQVEDLLKTPFVKVVYNNSIYGARIRQEKDAYIFGDKEMRQKVGQMDMPFFASYPINGGAPTWYTKDATVTISLLNDTTVDNNYIITDIIAGGLHSDKKRAWAGYPPLDDKDQKLVNAFNDIYADIEKSDFLVDQPTGSIYLITDKLIDIKNAMIVANVKKDVKREVAEEFKTIPGKWTIKTLLMDFQVVLTAPSPESDVESVDAFKQLPDGTYAYNSINITDSLNKTGVPQKQIFTFSVPQPPTLNFTPTKVVGPLESPSITRTVENKNSVRYDTKLPRVSRIFSTADGLVFHFVNGEMSSIDLNGNDVLPGDYALYLAKDPEDLNNGKFYYRDQMAGWKFVGSMKGPRGDLHILTWVSIKQGPTTGNSGGQLTARNTSEILNLFKDPSILTNVILKDVPDKKDRPKDNEIIFVDWKDSNGVIQGSYYVARNAHPKGNHDIGWMMIQVSAGAAALLSNYTVGTAADEKSYNASYVNSIVRNSEIGSISGAAELKTRTTYSIAQLEKIMTWQEV